MSNAVSGEGVQAVSSGNVFCLPIQYHTSSRHWAEHGAAVQAMAVLAVFSSGSRSAQSTGLSLHL